MIGDFLRVLLLTAALAGWQMCCCHWSAVAAAADGCDAGAALAAAEYRINAAASPHASLGCAEATSGHCSGDATTGRCSGEATAERLHGLARLAKLAAAAGCGCGCGPERDATAIGLEVVRVANSPPRKAPCHGCQCGGCLPRLLWAPAPGSSLRIVEQTGSSPVLALHLPDWGARAMRVAPARLLGPAPPTTLLSLRCALIL